MSDPFDLFGLDDLKADQLRSRSVFVRVDFNVPMKGDQVVDDTRIREALPSIQRLRSAGARVLLGSHRGRPKGERREEFSLAPIAPAVARLLEDEVSFASDCVGAEAKKAVDALRDGSVCLLENLRFHAGEESCDEAFVHALGELADVYVGDAFGTAHRRHASTAGLPEYCRTKAAGLLMQREVEVLGSLLQAPTKPFLALLGGAKISGKIDTLQRLVENIDGLLIGGGMANTFLVAQGHDLGGSLYEEDKVEVAREILTRCSQRAVEVLLPVDLVVTEDLKAEKPLSEIVALDAAGDQRCSLEANRLAVDLGPHTCSQFRAAIAKAETLFWNGPMGVFETPPFDAGSRAIAEAVGECSGFTVIGGGETVAAAALGNAVDRIDHVSTGGGASLALLAGKELPGLEALRRR